MLVGTSNQVSGTLSASDFCNRTRRLTLAAILIIVLVLVLVFASASCACTCTGNGNGNGNGNGHGHDNGHGNSPVGASIGNRGKRWISGADKAMSGLMMRHTAL